MSDIQNDPEFLGIADRSPWFQSIQVGRPEGRKLDVMGLARRCVPVQGGGLSRSDVMLVRLSVFRRTFENIRKPVRSAGLNRQKHQCDCHGNDSAAVKPNVEDRAYEFLT